MRYALSIILIGLSVAGQGVAADRPVATYVVAPEIEDCIEGWEMPVRVSLEPAPITELGVILVTDLFWPRNPLGRVSVLEIEERRYVKERRGLTDVVSVEIPPAEDDIAFADTQNRTDESLKIPDILQDVVDKARMDYDFVQEMAPKLAVELDACTSPFGERIVHGVWSLDGESELHTLHQEGEVEIVSEIIRARAGALNVVFEQDEAISYRIAFRAVDLFFVSHASDGISLHVDLNFSGKVQVVPGSQSGNVLPEPAQFEMLDLSTGPLASSGSGLLVSNSFRELPARVPSATGRYILQNTPNEDCNPATEYPILARIDSFRARPRYFRNSNTIRSEIEQDRMENYLQSLVFSLDVEISGCFGLDDTRLTETALVLKGEGAGHMIDYQTRWTGIFNDDEWAQFFMRQYNSVWSIGQENESEVSYTTLVNNLTNFPIPIRNTVGPKVLRPRPVDLDFSFVLMPDTSLTPQLLQEVTQ